MTANLTSTPKTDAQRNGQLAKRQRIDQEETKGKKENEMILDINIKNERNNGSLLTIRT